MKRDNIIKTFLISFSTLILLSIFGFTYAYFSLEIEGTPKDIVMNTGDLRLEYKDETKLALTNALPGDSITKVITVKNVGTKKATYSLYWGDLINTIENYELHITLNCKSYINYGKASQTESGICNNIYRAVPISSTKITGTIKNNISIDPNITQEYTVTVTFDNKNYSQNDNLNKTFTGKIGIQEYITPAVTNCTFDGEMVQGAEYVNGQYTYRYMQEGVDSPSGLNWTNITTDGWGVQLTNKTSTNEANGEVCTYINNKPVVSSAYMFARSRASAVDMSKFNTSNIINMKNMFASTIVTSLDLSKFNTSNVTNMNSMFMGAQATSVDLSSFDTSNVTDLNLTFGINQIETLDLSNFDTSNVTNMSYMFYGSQATSIDTSSFDTSNVINMSYMFSDSYVKKLDLSNFNTNNVTSMSYMFCNASTTSLDVSKFDTKKVIDMSKMFDGTPATIIDVSNFNTSNVTNMNWMFAGTSTSTLNISGFNTSKVTDMNHMFYNSNASVLDLSNFDTRNVTDMSFMFNGSKATTINLNNLNTSNVTTMRTMFYNSKVTDLDLSSFDTSKVTDMADMFGISKIVTLKGLETFNTSNVTNMSFMFEITNLTSLDLSSFDTSKVTNMSRMFFTMFKLKTIYVSNKFTTNNVTSSDYMFGSNASLVGGNGTKFNSSYVDKTYARIDTANTPGYFTAKQ